MQLGSLLFVIITCQDSFLPREMVNCSDFFNETSNFQLGGIFLQLPAN